MTKLRLVAAGGCLFLLVAAFVSFSSVSPQAGEKSTETKEIAVSSPDTLNGFPVIGLGDPDAPVYLVEYASLSCGHCADFHNNILPQLKEEFVDAGKVFIEFRDFPTSRSGFDAAKLVRCMPESRQYKFMDLLFQTQAQWAFTNDTGPLFQNAKLAGMSQTAIDACLTDKEHEKKLLESVQLARDTYQVSSTPTIIAFPSKEKLTGIQRYKSFKKQIERALKAAEK